MAMGYYPITIKNVRTLTFNRVTFLVL